LSRNVDIKIYKALLLLAFLVVVQFFCRPGKIIQILSDNRALRKCLDLKENNRRKDPSAEYRGDGLNSAGSKYGAVTDSCQYGD
jgi:hypothetical protein